MDNNYYVYEWIRLDTNEPFYIGKGKNNRCYKLTRDNNMHFNNIVKSVPTAVNIIHTNLDEETAFGLEIYYIWLYRDIIGYDLVNLTDGGEGYSCRGSFNHKSIKVICLNNLQIFESICMAQEKYGAICIQKCCEGIYDYAGKTDELGYLAWAFYDDYLTFSKDDIENKINLAQNQKCGNKNSFYNKHHSDDAKAKISKSLSGRHPSESTREKLRKCNSGKNNNMYGKRGKDSPLYGIPKSDECKKKLSEANGRKVRCVELDMVFVSLSEAERYMQSLNIKFNRRALVKFLKGEYRKSYYGEIIKDNKTIQLHWEYV